MKRTVFVALVLIAAVGCAPPPANDGTAKRVAALEMRVDTLQKRNDDLTLKARIISNQLFDSPLDRFFASPEFWENTYDSGQADCARRCTQTLQTEYAACETSTNPTKCRNDALQRASRCQTNCSKNFPPSFP